MIATLSKIWSIVRRIAEVLAALVGPSTSTDGTSVALAKDVLQVIANPNSGLDVGHRWFARLVAP